MSTNPASRIPSPVVAFIGGGNMARSLIGGLIRNGTPAASITVSEPSADLRAALARDFSVAAHAENAAAATNADVLVLAVKPQVMKTVCAGLREIAQSRKPLVVSIAAGFRFARLNPCLGGGLAIVRCSPNTRPLIAAGAAAFIAIERTTPTQKNWHKTFFPRPGSRSG